MYVCNVCGKNFRLDAYLKAHVDRKMCKVNVAKFDQDTGRFRTNTLDKFYTHPEVAKECIASILEIVPESIDYTWIEPSAGNGSFFHNAPPTVKKVGIDLEPGADDIILYDFLKWEAPAEDIIIFGNPPFGRQSALAKAFIAKSCRIAKIIAFILPKSFIKPSMYNVFEQLFHMVHNRELGDDSFIVNNDAYNVPCVFQIWKKLDYPRAAFQRIDPVGFSYVKKSDNYDFAFRRVGVYAGRCYEYGGPYSVQSHYFIKLNSAIFAKKVIDGVNAHNFPNNTVGPRSLSKNEANAVINAVIASVS